MRLPPVGPNTNIDFGTVFGGRSDEKRIKRELEAIATERQWTITQARKGGITTTDMEGQLSILTMQELNLKTELASLGQAISTNMLTNWEAKFNEYLEDLRAGIEELKNAAPETPEERHRVFLLKKKVVDVLLEEATIDEYKEIHVKIRVDLLKIVGDDPESGDSTLSAVETQSGGIYIHILSFPARRHHLSFFL